jgi:signal transduction histidine kinase
MVATFIAIVCRSMLQILGLIQGGAFLLQSPAWRGVFIPMAVIAYMWQRDRAQNKALVQGQIEQAISEVQVKEKNLSLAKQSQFMAMLMHELKTPLYTIQVASASLSRHITVSNPDIQRLDNIARATDDMNFIIDRCVQADQLDQNDLHWGLLLPSLKFSQTPESKLKRLDHLGRADQLFPAHP